MKPIRRTGDLVVQKLDAEVLVYDLKLDKAFCLNETSAKVWSLCDGTRDAARIAAELSDVRRSGSEVELVRLALSQLADQDLLDVPITEFEDTVSRRDLIAIAGKTAAIALPMVSTLIVPSAIMAQSAATCSGNSGVTCSCIGKVRNFSIPCASSNCTQNCQCQPPFTGCNGGGHFCQGTCG